MDTQDTRRSAEHFLALIKASHRGKFKVYIGMSAGVGKTYRMLQEAHQLLDAGVDVLIGYIETHGRPETEALTEGLPFIPRRKLFYKGKELEEMDMQAIINLHPDIVVVDELAHTNIEGSANPKRWQDVMQILDAGISVISAVNIQHIEGVNEQVQEITGIEVHERVPDSVLATADEVVNIDLTADELIERLKAGKIYKPDKVPTALSNSSTSSTAAAGMARSTATPSFPTLRSTSQSWPSSSPVRRGASCRSSTGSARTCPRRCAASIRSWPSGWPSTARNCAVICTRATPSSPTTSKTSGKNTKTTKTKKEDACIASILFSVSRSSRLGGRE